MLQIRKSKLEARATAKTRAENNQSDPGKNLLENEILNNIIKDEDLLRDLSILNNKYLQIIFAETIYEWRNSDIKESFAIITTSHMWNVI